MKNENDDIASLITEAKDILIDLIIWAFISIGYAYVFSLLWEWFVVATFNVPIVNLPQALGLVIMVTLLKARNLDVKKISQEEMRASQISRLQLLTILLVKGWIITQFI